MDTQNLLNRIEINPTVMAGKPVVRGTRLTVQFILGLLQHGATFQEILDEYEGLERQDIEACLLFAKESLDSSTFMPLATKNE